MTRILAGGAAWVAAAAMLLFLVVPLAVLVLGTSPGQLWRGLADPAAWAALRLSLFTTTASLGVVLLLGTPLAWRLARSTSRAAALAERAVQLPVVVPPAVGGLALLLAFGQAGLGTPLPFTTAAVVLAEVFVGAPFFLQSAIAAFRRLDEEHLRVARSLGASPARAFFRVALPLCRNGLAGGAAMCWSRALGEFGATLMFAGSLRGRTQTLPLAIYAALESDVGAARAMAVVLVAAAFALLFVLRAAGRP